MATVDGNLLQRTRYSVRATRNFCDTALRACNKPGAGPGCETIDGVDRTHAAPGTGQHGIASHPGDWH